MDNLLLNLFFDFWRFFRENLKKEINYFTENVLIKILISSDASFLHKKIVFENFIKNNFHFFMELFINYDCDLTKKFIVKRLIYTIFDIIKGKFKNNKSISEKENYDLIILLLLSHLFLFFYFYIYLVFPLYHYLKKSYYLNYLFY